MANSPQSTMHDDTQMRELKWSQAEKEAARKAFMLALDGELEGVKRETEERIASIREYSQLWELEDWLTRRRQEIDRKYDYRYSVLPMVFAILLREGRLSEADLNGLSRDKLDCIRQAADI